MESMGNILNSSNLHMSEKKTDGGKLLDSRREVIRRQIMAFYLGCRRDVSSPEILETEIDLAMRDWEDIPTDKIEPCCRQAVKDAQGFMPTNGGVVKVWEDGIAESRRPKVQPFVALPPVRRTPEEIKQIEDMCRSIREGLK